jgi:hypothetical protein
MVVENRIRDQVDPVTPVSGTTMTAVEERDQAMESSPAVP